MKAEEIIVGVVVIALFAIGMIFIGGRLAEENQMNSSFDPRINAVYSSLNSTLESNTEHFSSTQQNFSTEGTSTIDTAKSNFLTVGSIFTLGRNMLNLVGGVFGAIRVFMAEYLGIPEVISGG